MSEDLKDKPDPTAELKAMGLVSEALKGLASVSVERVLRWASEAHEVAYAGTGKKVDAGKGAKGESGKSAQQEDHFETAADLFAHANPQTDDMRALVVAYWVQQHEGLETWGAQAVSAILKNLGHPPTNITGSFTRLKTQKPSLVIQMQKAGSSRQARKTYKVTPPGLDAVRKMLAGEVEE
jgi:hypothetical protein